MVKCNFSNIILYVYIYAYLKYTYDSGLCKLINKFLRYYVWILYLKVILRIFMHRMHSAKNMKCLVVILEFMTMDYFLRLNVIKIPEFYSIALRLFNFFFFWLKLVYKRFDTVVASRPIYSILLYLVLHIFLVPFI